MNPTSLPWVAPGGNLFMSQIWCGLGCGIMYEFVWETQTHYTGAELVMN